MSAQTLKRIRKEADQLRSRPCREFVAYPSESNPFLWYFTMRGPDDSCYSRGAYHGKILLPNNYPFAPPDIMLTTPNGRFELNKKICLSEVTSYHPENWQPSWGIHTVIHALREFMVTPGNNAIGAIEYSVEDRRRLAEESRTWVSPEGTNVMEHLVLMDNSPPWTERETVQPSQAPPTTTPATPEPTRQATPTMQPAASPAVSTPVTPPQPQPQSQPQPQQTPPPPVPAPVQPPTLQPQPVLTSQQEETLNHIIVMLLVGILAIMAKKYWNGELSLSHV
eukprot:Sspe_Gene.19177::Locus_6966_Transcript_1_1_Confidence_1.000_Length_915::g.19177::m.19177/K10578/UBE2J1, NCUBE1, UBC6; ubiquitin-conjugating enzyme E2 J1